MVAEGVMLFQQSSLHQLIAALVGTWLLRVTTVLLDVILQVVQQPCPSAKIFPADIYSSSSAPVIQRR